MKTYGRVLCSITLAALLIGCIAEEGSLLQVAEEDSLLQVAEEDSPLQGRRFDQAKYLVQASEHMAQLYRSGRSQAISANGAMHIDLSDPKQYQFVLARLHNAGIDHLNSPKLFANLATDRDRAVKNRERGIETFQPGTKDWCGHFLPMGANRGATSGSFIFTGIAEAACQNSIYTYADIVYNEANLDGSNSVYINSRAYEAYYTPFFDPTLSVTRTTKTGRKLVADSMLVAYDAVGTSQYTYQHNENGLLLADAAAIKQIDHPVQRINTSEITHCIRRGVNEGNLDCDYSSVRNNQGTLDLGYPRTGVAAINASASTSGSWIADATSYKQPAAAFDENDMYVRIKGSFDVGRSIVNLATPPNSPIFEWRDCKILSVLDNTEAKIILRDSGGYCTSKEAGSEVATAKFAANVVVNPTNQRFATFDFLADFGPDCTDYLQDVELSVEVHVDAECFVTSTIKNVQKRTDFVLMSDQPIPANSGYLEFKNSCFAVGTEVLLADGTYVPIEQVKVGDRISVGPERESALVASTILGGEAEPVIELVDDRGHSIRVTKGHPVVSASKGVVAAEDLQVGDQVLSDDGVTTLTSVKKVDYEGPVYNLIVENSAQRTITEDVKGGTIFANGFLMGDGELQDSLAMAEAREDDRPAIVKLPSSWYADYVHDSITHFLFQ